ncbi:MAG: isoleucine--tRNA ligase [Melioribacteraceae bacterium]|nr:isoleucine--tRNA ligase [Melioribacteraceae bacterium]
MFKQYEEKVSYPKLEESILAFWKDNNIFEKSISTRENRETFTFNEGPPTANGIPGIHHVMSRTLKDLVCRYKTMKGYQVNRKAGWDTHGLPVEIEVEKALGIKTKSEIPVFGVEKYNDACRTSVFKYKDLWEQMTDRMGYWLNMDEAYITCDNNYIESVWWALATLYNKGLIFKDYKIVPQCPRSETVLSSHELALGYKETKDPSVYVMMKLDGDYELNKDGETYFLIWTTTPWTLISNVALAVGAEIDYVKVKTDDKYLILAKERLEVLKNDYEIISNFKGAELAGISYKQLFDYVAVDKKGFYVVEADFVSTGDGSGIVHMAPAFGADDYEISKQYDLPFLQPVTPGGKFTKEVSDFEGVFVKDADKDIIFKLRENGNLYRKETITHTYPFSWRFDDVPVIYYARESWFIKTTSIASKMVELNKTINWHPPEVGSGRFGNWLEDNKDWALSRDRFWATPLPIWVSEDGEDQFAVGSIEELKKGYIEKDGVKISVADLPDEDIDLHKPFTDKIHFKKNGKIYKRTPELIDVWFDSGAMPFAQYHYPFENKELFEKNYPADYICEGIDQTRGWFYTMHAIGTMLFDSISYKNLIVNELILDKKGLKMSKTKGNTVSPFELFDKYGADATRWYLVTTSPPWKPTLFDEDGIVEVQRKFFGTLLNTYNFFALYSNIDKVELSEAKVPYDKRPEVDRWIISKLNTLVKEYELLMDNYDVTKAARAVQSFTIDELSNWYVRRSRRRFWKAEVNENKLSAYQTLYECLITISKLTAPFAPFVAEEIYQNLNRVGGTENCDSVHLVEYPTVTFIDKELEAKMEIAQRVVFLTRSMRAKSNLKVRQPLSRIMVAIDKEKRDAVSYMKDVILEEVNIKELVVLENDSSIVNKSAKANFKNIGPKFGKLVKKIAAEITTFNKEQIALLEKEKSILINIDGENIELSSDDVEIINSEIEGWVVETEEGITVAIDSELNNDLIAEGYAREFVNRIQNMRKDAGFDVMDRIKILYQTDSKLSTFINQFSDYIMRETLADLIENIDSDEGYKQDWELGDFICTITVQRSK